MGFRNCIGQLPGTFHSMQPTVSSIKREQPEGCDHSHEEWRKRSLLEEETMLLAAFPPAAA